MMSQVHKNAVYKGSHIMLRQSQNMIVYNILFKVENYYVNFTQPKLKSIEQGAF